MISPHTIFTVATSGAPFLEATRQRNPVVSIITTNSNFMTRDAKVPPRDLFIVNLFTPTRFSSSKKASSNPARSNIHYISKKYQYFLGKMVPWLK
jgi:hypothetical protein